LADPRTGHPNTSRLEFGDRLALSEERGGLGALDKTWVDIVHRQASINVTKSNLLRQYRVCDVSAVVRCYSSGVKVVYLIARKC
jgi:hypothetical protein